jgi:molybdenum cofactor guanylyltransferase
MSRPPRRVAVVLAGGTSRRFGSDKLEVDVDGLPLLDRAMEGLPEDVDVIVVGPERAARRTVSFVRENPPGGGPTAALVAGLRAGLERGAEQIVVLPGDAPGAGLATVLLLSVLAVQPSVAAVMATDGSGFDQPLQLALRRTAATDLVVAAGRSNGHGQSARTLVNRLDPPPLRCPVALAELWDVDTPDQLIAWELRGSAAVGEILAAAATSDVGKASPRPLVIGLDGRSGSGKSTLAQAICLEREATVVRGDDFYSPALATLDPVVRDNMTGAQIADAVIDWRRLRTSALGPLRRRQPARFDPYDWAAGDGRLGSAKELPPSDLVVLDGVYSTRPELADLIDLAVFVDAAEDVRWRRLLLREQDEPSWTEFWERGESYYFAQLRPVESFDLRVRPRTV